MLVVRLGHERKPSAGSECVVLERVDPIGHAGDLDHANARILAAHELAGRSIAQAKSGAAPLEPEPESLLGPPFRHVAQTLVAAGHAWDCPQRGSPRRVFRDEADTAFVTNV